MKIKIKQKVEKEDSQLYLHENRDFNKALLSIKKIDSKLENDILIETSNNQIHLLNSISPAWTCSFKTADFVVNDILGLIK